jgi:hypothetical protein
MLQIDSRVLNVRSVVPLFNKVKDRASDLEICKTLFTLISRLDFQQTSWKFGTGRFVESSDFTRKFDPTLAKRSAGQMAEEGAEVRAPHKRDR